jgi:hypothetical protein
LRHVFHDIQDKQHVFRTATLVPAITAAKTLVARWPGHDAHRVTLAGDGLVEPGPFGPIPTSATVICTFLT